MGKVFPSVLTIAGSDSGGGAGIQADLRTFNAFNVYGCSVITAVTAQNPYEVRKVEVLTLDTVKSQLECVLDAFPIRFAKTGMLAKSEIVECVAEIAQKHDLQLIVDPVMVSTSGSRLLEKSAISAMKEKLFPIARWLTPNIPEAELICNRKLAVFDDLADAAADIYRQYKCNVVLKSGHAISSNKVTDVICYKGDIFTLSSPVAEVCGNTAHGTGCTLSAALAANFASGKNWQESLKEAKAFVYGSLCGSVKLSDTLFQMYPPENNNLNPVILEKL
ncbi:MAG: bifunctional hydroxymethylpyrimidine kinase/phosphomethylpyrimidine kinase [Lentisphaeria bacterium]|nr:bifunctional hydroxymethylpyrimidine kinase/phosphomethylpyrimidine kinase [Lentisphaeria bacterium]